MCASSSAARPQRFHVMSCLPTSIVSLVGAGVGTFARGHLRQRKVSRGRSVRCPIRVLPLSRCRYGAVCIVPVHQSMGIWPQKSVGLLSSWTSLSLAGQEICTTVVEKTCRGDTRGGTMCCLLSQPVVRDDEKTRRRCDNAFGWLENCVLVSLIEIGKMV